jgi:SAM-dependent methyltransferase
VLVSLSDVFASNALVRWLRGDPGRYELLTRMIGARLGDRVLSFGGGDPGLVAALARVTGLSGRAVAHAASTGEATRMEATAEAAGVLVEVIESPANRLPFKEGDFDLVLVDAVSAPFAALLPEIRRVLRSGGRVVLVIRQREPGAPPSAAVHAATGLHFRGARVLFERDGFGIVEALKGQPTSS